MKKNDYKSVHFHYFTGTGNSEKVCEWIAAHAKSNGIQTFSFKINEPFEPVVVPSSNAL